MLRRHALGEIEVRRAGTGWSRIVRRFLVVGACSQQVARLLRGFGISWWPAGEIARLPGTNSWNVAVSRAIKGNLILDFTYTGSKGTHLASDRVNYMQIPDQYARLGSLLNKPAPHHG